MPRASKKTSRNGTEKMVGASPFAPDANAPFIYASSMQLLASTYDFMLILAQARVVEGGLRLHHAGTVAISPGHAKVLARLLAEKVAEYEAQNGTINLPAGPHTAPVKL